MTAAEMATELARLAARFHDERIQLEKTPDGRAKLAVWRQEYKRLHARWMARRRQTRMELE